MPRRNLTNAFIKSAKPNNNKLTEYWDEKEAGLILRVTPAGFKSWSYRYRLKSGKPKRMSLGKLRDVSLAKARDLTVINRASVAIGGDPASEAKNSRHDAKQQRDKETTKDVGEWYFRECEKGRHKPNVKYTKRKSTIENERYFFNKHITPTFGNQKIANIDRGMIQSFVDGVADKHSPSIARQCRIILHGVYAFAQRQEVVAINPCQFVSVASLPARERVLTDTEVRTIWNALTPPIAIKNASISLAVAYSILIALVTLQRRGEVTGMRIDELDNENKLWTIPSHRTKNHHTHAVPLSDLAVELIEKAADLNKGNDKFVFPSPRNAEEPIAARAMTRAFARIRKPLNLVDARPHDFRRTGATNLTSERLGFQRFVVSKILNHSSDTGNAATVTGFYDRNEYLPQKRKALDAWAERLIEIVEEESSLKSGDNI